MTWEERVEAAAFAVMVLALLGLVAVTVWALVHAIGSGLPGTTVVRVGGHCR